MAGRILNRRELRKQTDQAQLPMPLTPGPGVVAAPATTTGKPPGSAPRGRKPRKKKEPPRFCARWCVYDAAMKQVAVFDYNQRAAAEQKIVDLASRKKRHPFPPNHQGDHASARSSRAVPCLSQGAEGKIILLEWTDYRTRSSQLLR